MLRRRTEAFFIAIKATISPPMADDDDDDDDDDEPDDGEVAAALVRLCVALA